MVADLVAVIFVLALTGLGWFRGVLAQVVPLGGAVLLWWFWDSWYAPIDGILAGLGSMLSLYPSVRHMVGGLLGWFALVLVSAVVELVVVRRVDLLDAGNRWFGALFGFLKGLVYSALLVWIVEGILLWGRPPDQGPPPWMRESLAFQHVGPWNPLKVYTLREVLARGSRSKGEQAAAPVEESARARALYLASPVRKIVDETSSTTAWEGTGYVDMVSDPRVRDVLRDDSVGFLLFGD